MDKRTWAEVDLDAIAHNIKEIRKITNPNAKIINDLSKSSQLLSQKSHFWFHLFRE